MDVLISDRAQMEISNKVKDILRHLIIDDWQSEAHYQHQNAAERRYKHIKRNVQNVLNISGATASCWLLCLEYVTYFMNHMATKSLSWCTPYESLTGIIPDISVIYRFLFYDKIYFQNTNSGGDSHSFPSESNERLGRFVGFSTHVGHGMTYKILTSDTHIYGNMKESLPHDALKAYGPPVIMTTYVDANLCHDFVTGRSVTVSFIC